MVLVEEEGLLPLLLLVATAAVRRPREKRLGSGGWLLQRQIPPLETKEVAHRGATAEVRAAAAKRRINIKIMSS